MNINSSKIKRIVMVPESGEQVVIIGYILATYINREDGKVVFTEKHLPNTRLNFPKERFKEESNIKYYDFYINYTDANNNPITSNTRIPEVDATYFLDVVKVSIPKTPIEIEYDGTNQTSISYIIISSTKKLYFSVDDDGPYSFHILTEDYPSGGVHNHYMAFEIIGFKSSPGLTFYFSPKLYLYLDSPRKLLGHTYVNIIVYDITEGNQD